MNGRLKELAVLARNQLVPFPYEQPFALPLRARTFRRKTRVALPLNILRGKTARPPNEVGKAPFRTGQPAVQFALSQ